MTGVVVTTPVVVTTGVVVTTPEVTGVEVEDEAVDEEAVDEEAVDEEEDDEEEDPVVEIVIEVTGGVVGDVVVVGGAVVDPPIQLPTTKIRLSVKTSTPYTGPFTSELNAVSVVPFVSSRAKYSLATPLTNVKSPPTKILPSDRIAMQFTA